MRIIFAAEIQLVCRFDKIRFFRLEDVFDVRLWVAIDQGKPAALDVDHEPVTFFEGVKDVLHRHVDRRDLVGNERFRL